jgi:thiosulfate dehydrogenase [quinone] large subunit
VKTESLLSLVRIVLGSILLWSFADKLFGLGFATSAERSWLQGTSPTAGFLQFGIDGPFASVFQSLAGSLVIDWLFMLGLAGIGVALILGIGLRIAGYSGALLMLLLYLAVFPSENNPLFDEHIVYLLLFLVFSKKEIGLDFSLTRRWEKLSIVRKYSILQ